MTKTTRIALALSSSILSLGVALAPTAFAAGTHAKTSQATMHKAKATHHAKKATKAKKSMKKAPMSHAAPAAKTE